MEQETVLHIEGTVEQVLYRNEQNGYTVLDLDANGTLITVVGELGDVEEGEQLSVDGTYVNHVRFGVQFQAQYVERKLPEDAINIQRYLSSGVIKGIGSALAKNCNRIWQSDIGNHGEAAHSPDGNSGYFSEKMRGNRTGSTENFCITQLDAVSATIQHSLSLCDASLSVLWQRCKRNDSGKSLFAVWNGNRIAV